MGLWPGLLYSIHLFSALIFSPFSAVYSISTSSAHHSISSLPLPTTLSPPFLCPPLYLSPSPALYYISPLRLPSTISPPLPALQRAISEKDSVIAVLELQPDSERQVEQLRLERARLMRDLNDKAEQRLKLLRRDSVVSLEQKMGSLALQYQNCDREQVRYGCSSSFVA